MAVNLTQGGMLKVSADNYCTSNDLKPVVQVTDFSSDPFRISHDKKWYFVGLSDGSFWQYHAIASEFCISNKLQQGSIIQLTKYYYSKHRFVIFVCGLHVIRSKCDIIGDPSLLPLYVPPMSDHEIKLLCHNEDVNKPLALTKKCSSSQSQSNKKRKREVQSSNHNISTVAKEISKIVKMVMEKEDKLMAVANDVSKMKRMMMKKNKEDDMGACIEKLEEMGWGAQDPMYDTALLLFGQSADYRKLWLHLKPESCGKWVKNAGSVFGLLD